MATTTRRRKVMMGLRVTDSTRTAFRVWCTQRGQTVQQVLEADVRRHLLTPAIAPIPRDRALVRIGRRWPGQLWRRLNRFRR